MKKKKPKGFKSKDLIWVKKKLRGYSEKEFFDKVGKRFNVDWTQATTYREHPTEIFPLTRKGKRAEMALLFWRNIGEKTHSVATTSWRDSGKRSVNADSLLAITIGRKPLWHDVRYKTRDEKYGVWALSYEGVNSLKRVRELADEVIVLYLEENPGVQELVKQRKKAKEGVNIPGSEKYNEVRRKENSAMYEANRERYKEALKTKARNDSNTNQQMKQLLKLSMEYVEASLQVPVLGQYHELISETLSAKRGSDVRLSDILDNLARAVRTYGEFVRYKKSFDKRGNAWDRNEVGRKALEIKRYLQQLQNAKPGW